ncbi:uncharacterized protein [Montipora foliosa]|uniref:uncharacterized protein n=1 Tax=Montipora foliosa TaxID=591990 RepID=UPI0035F10EBD
MRDSQLYICYCLGLLVLYLRNRDETHSCFTFGGGSMDLEPLTITLELEYGNAAGSSTFFREVGDHGKKCKASNIKRRGKSSSRGFPNILKPLNEGKRSLKYETHNSKLESVAWRALTSHFRFERRQFFFTLAPTKAFANLAVNSAKHLATFLVLIYFLISSLTAVLRWESSRTKRNVRLFGRSSTEPAFSILPFFSKTYGTLFFLLSLSAIGSSSSISKIMVPSSASASYSIGCTNLTQSTHLDSSKLNVSYFSSWVRTVSAATSTAISRKSSYIHQDKSGATHCIITADSISSFSYLAVQSTHSSSPFSSHSIMSRFTSMNSTSYLSHSPNLDGSKVSSITTTFLPEATSQKTMDVAAPGQYVASAPSAVTSTASLLLSTSLSVSSFLPSASSSLTPVVSSSHLSSISQLSSFLSVTSIFTSSTSSSSFVSSWPPQSLSIPLLPLSFFSPTQLSLSTESLFPESLTILSISVPPLPMFSLMSSQLAAGRSTVNNLSDVSTTFHLFSTIPSHIYSQQNTPPRVLPSSSSSSVFQSLTVRSPLLLGPSSWPSLLSASTPISSIPPSASSSLALSASVILLPLSSFSSTRLSSLSLLSSPSSQTSLTTSFTSSSSLPKLSLRSSLSASESRTVNTAPDVSAASSLLLTIPSHSSASQLQTPRMFPRNSSKTIYLRTQTTHPLTSKVSLHDQVLSVSSSIIHNHPTTSDKRRIILLNFSLINEDYHRDLSNGSSIRHINMSQRVSSTLWILFNTTVEGLNEIRLIQFSNGSVKVDSELYVSSLSNVTTTQIQRTLISSNGTNMEGFIFNKISVKEICTPGFCMNSGICSQSENGANCSCIPGFIGPRCYQKVSESAVDGNYTEWTDFTECSKTCGGGQRSRSRTCTNPPPRNGGKDCMEIGRQVEYADCNDDVRCPISTEILIVIGLSCGVFLLLIVLIIICFVRRRRKQTEPRTTGFKDFFSNGYNAAIPLEVIYEDKTVLNASLKGHSNPEFIGDGHDDDNDIYKAQLLLFLKQSHLTRPNVFQDVQDNKTDQLESPRKMSSLSTTSEKKDEKTGATEETKVADIEKSSPKGEKKQVENFRPTTEL